MLLMCFKSFQDTMKYMFFFIMGIHIEFLSFRDAYYQLRY